MGRNGGDEDGGDEEGGWWEGMKEMRKEVGGKEWR